MSLHFRPNQIIGIEVEDRKYCFIEHEFEIVSCIKIYCLESGKF